MKKGIRIVFLFLMAAFTTPKLSAQSLDPTGPSTNLCPGKLFTYTSPPSDPPCNVGGAGWGCTGCKDGNVQSSGVNPDGSVWATVIWDNTIDRKGSVQNGCGGLDVTINNIPQPIMNGSSTVLLCGTNSITLSASATPTTNITGYIWEITTDPGTQISPTGTVTTSGPQLTINYSNWTAGGTMSAQVAVGTLNSCGFHTDVSPLTANDFLPAIPRSAWVQLSPGNIDNLKIPYVFSPTLICSNSAATMHVTNQPAGTNISWSSGNTNAINFTNASTGAAQVGNYNGSATVTATLSSACGSYSESKTIWLGRPIENSISINGDTSPFPTCNTGSIPFTTMQQNIIQANIQGVSNVNYTLNGTAGVVSGGALSASEYEFTPKSSTAKFTIDLSASNGCGGDIYQCLYFSNTSGSCPPPEITSIKINGSNWGSRSCGDSYFTYTPNVWYTIQVTNTSGSSISYSANTTGVTTQYVNATTFKVRSSVSQSFPVHITASNICGSTGACIWFSNSGGPAPMLVRQGPSDVQVHPNQASSSLRVQLTDSAGTAWQGATQFQALMYNRFSQVVYSVQTSDPNFQIPVDGLPEDIYYLTVIHNGAVLQKQIVVKR